MADYQKLRAATYLMLKKDDKILLMKRQNTGFKDGYWSLMAGHIDEGERAREAMVREAMEELGIEINPSDLKPYNIIHRNSRDNIYVDIFFHLKDWSGEIENMEPEKCEKLEWFSKDDLPEKTIGYVRKAIQEGGEKLDYMEYGWK